MASYHNVDLSVFKSDAELAEIELLHGYSKVLLQFAHVCCLIFTLVGIPGNLITIIALAICEKFRNAIAYFIINLHVTNLIYCFVILPMMASVFSTQHWTFGKTMCIVYPYLKYVLVGCAHFTVVGITINRYIIVCHPHVYHRLYKKSILIIILLFAWILPVIMFLPTLLKVWGSFGLDAIGSVCTMVPDENGRSAKTFFVSFAFVGPYLIIIACYARIWWTVKKAARKRNAHNRGAAQPAVSVNSESESSEVKIEPTSLVTIASENSTTDKANILDNTISSTPNASESNVVKLFKSRRKIQKRPLPTRKDKKLATMIVGILIAFMVCYLPIMLIRFVYGDYISHPTFNILAHLLEYSAAFTSPLIYVIMSRDYRQAYSYLFKVIKEKISNYVTIITQR